MTAVAFDLPFLTWILSSTYAYSFCIKLQAGNGILKLCYCLQTHLVQMLFEREMGGGSGEGREREGERETNE